MHSSMEHNANKTTELTFSPQINIWVSAIGDEIIRLNKPFYMRPYKEIEGVQMLLDETSDLHMHINQQSKLQ